MTTVIVTRASPICLGVRNGEVLAPPQSIRQNFSPTAERAMR